MNALTLSGYIGAAGFAVCAIPQVWQVYKDKHADGMNNYFILLWVIGELGTLIYVAGTIGFLNPLFLNYASNLIWLVIILYYKYWGANVKQKIR